MHPVIESTTRSKTQELKFWLLSATRAQAWCENFTQVSKTWVTWVPLEPECSKPSSCSSNAAAALAWLVPWESTECSDMCEMLHPIRRGEKDGWDDLGTAQQNLPVICSKLQNSSLYNYFPLPTPPKKKKKVKHSTGQRFKGWFCFISPQCSSAFGENVAVVLLKNNKSYGIPLNWANAGRRDTERFKVLVWRKRFWIKQFYVILQVVWAIILYVRLYHCSLECSYNTDLIMHRKKISHLLDSFLLFKSRKEQKGSYFLKEIVRFYCRKVAACAELEL